MADDLIARLYCSYADPPCEACTFCAARAEIERLREQVAEMLPWFEDIVVGCALALDENERLRAEVARLGAFLHPIGEQARRG